MRGNETVNGSRIRVYESGEKSVDRYTVVFMDREAWGYVDDNGYPCLAMSADPFHPQGVGQHSSVALGKHLGRRIPFAELPEACQKLILSDF